MIRLNQSFSTPGPGRRTFVKAGAGCVLSAQAAWTLPPAGPLRFGLIADIHHSLMPGAQKRLESFLDQSERRSLDFLLQPGHFCHGFTATPTPDQKQFLRTWHKASVKLPKYSVLGNHEMDRCAKPVIMDLLEMKRPYYSFDAKGFHFVVLDCMHIQADGKVFDYADGNYFRHTADQINWINQEQLEWLAADLKATALPTVVFTHPCIHSFWAPGAEATRTNAREAFEEANAAAGRTKVIACFSGHHHIDHYSQGAGIHYFLVNSASYYWVGDAYGRMAKYRDPLFTFVTLTPDGTIAVEATNSVFIPPTPAQLHHPDAARVTTSIEARSVRFSPSSRP